MAARTSARATDLRSFTRDDTRSRGRFAEGENRLVHGDNLDALRWLARPEGGGFAGRVRCAYLDPPFNSGRTFAEYADALAPSEWISMMVPRIEAVATLVADDGAVFIEIDDTMLADLIVACDGILGRKNRVSIVTVVRSASTGHKAINAGPVNASDYLLVYAKDRRSWRCNPQWRVREKYDAAYGKFIPNRGDDVSEWRFESLRRHALASLGYDSAREARLALGIEGAARAIERFAIAHAESVVRFAQPRIEAVSKEARAWIERSRRRPKTTLQLVRDGAPDMVLRAGNRVLFLADKVRDGVLVEPITNVWTDVPFQGIAREGGVVFARNKKPERLVERVIAMSTNQGDWVLDPFLGSGTTASVAHKMRRRWVGIERGSQLQTMCIPRLGRVVDGDDRTGITTAHAWKGGGGFGVYA